MLHLSKLAGLLVVIMLFTTGCLQQLHNEARANAGLGELIYNTNLHNEANAVAERLAARCSGVGSSNLENHHTTSEGLKQIANRSLGPRSWKLVGENIAITTAVDQENVVARIHDGFMNSAGHRANILNPRYDTFAEGWAYQECGGVGYLFVAAIFIDRA